jgi:hypothetical protein
MTIVSPRRPIARISYTPASSMSIAVHVIPSSPDFQNPPDVPA